MKGSSFLCLRRICNSTNTSRPPGLKEADDVVGRSSGTCSITQGSMLGPVLFISYTDDVTLILGSHQVNHHLYADDKQAYVSTPVNNVSLMRQILEHCISDITSWCASCRLQLNVTKTELIRFGFCQMLEKLIDSDLMLDDPSFEVCVCDLGVHLNNELMMKIHISKIVSSCYHQLCRICQVCRLIGQDVIQQLVSASSYHDLTTAAHCCLICQG